MDDTNEIENNVFLFYADINLATMIIKNVGIAKHNRNKKRV